MGEPSVFSISTSGFFGIGISFTKMSGEYGKALDICIFLPFLYLSIFTAKTKHNKWFKFLDY